MTLLAYPLVLSPVKPLRLLAFCSFVLFLGALLLTRSLLLFILNGFVLTILFAATLPWDRYAIDLYGAALYSLLLYLFWELSALYTRYDRYQFRPPFALYYGLYLLATAGGLFLLTLLLGVIMISSFGTISGLFRPLLLAIGSVLAILGFLLWLILWYRKALEKQQ
jgi:hypothetical protein